MVDPVKLGNDWKLKIEDYDPKFDYPEHPECDKVQGIHLRVPPSENGGYLETGMSFIPKLGKKIYSGDFNLLTIIPPATCLMEDTMVKCLGDSISVIAKYTQESTLTPDPKERIYLIASGYIASLHVADATSKGLIPIPSFQNEYVEGNFQDGTRLKSSFVTRSPLCSQVVINGPSESYALKMVSKSNSKVVGINPNNLKGGGSSDITIKLKDGTTYIITYPTFTVNNGCTSDKRVYFNNDIIPYIWDKTNKLMLKFEFKMADKSS